ncbi:MAG: hypothetical protein ACI8TP_001433 [Acidimicrobiales bacterium]
MVRRAMAIAVLLMGLAFVGSPVASAEEPLVPIGSCPQMTDSIVRLYDAYFRRQPDAAGFDYWVRSYSSGAYGLAGVSAAFAHSPEFAEQYGHLDDVGFIELAYRNVLGRPADPAGRSYWLSVLRSGSPRGAVMLAFSESEEFVAASGTVPPLAGYLRIYPAGTRWFCGQGSAQMVLDRPAGAVYVDVLALNADSERDAHLRVRTIGGRTVVLADQALSVAQYQLSWNQRLTDGPTGGLRLLDVVSSSDLVRWTVVFAPASVAADRPGWDRGEMIDFG